MPIISLSYLVFLLFAVAFFRFCPVKWRWIILFLSSLVFIRYGHPWIQVVLFAFAGFNFLVGLLQERKSGFARFMFALALLLNSSSIILVRYLESVHGNITLVFHETGFRTDINVLSLGFTFYILQHIGYLTDCYYRRIQPERNPFRFILYTAFFPKFTSGPLETYQELAPQLRQPAFSAALFREGVDRILLGFFKKMVLSDRLAPIVARVYEDGGGQGSMVTISGICLFSLQLYFDFSAYSDIAIGTARLFGIRLSENFNRPFSSTSISEFWRRWHMSLMNWFSQYIYYPLVFRLRDKGKAAVVTGLIVTLLVSGIWHGLGYTFLVWSLLHATYLCYETLTKRLRLRWSEQIPGFIYKPASILITFSLVSFSNLFFRSRNIKQAGTLLSDLISPAFSGKTLSEGFMPFLAGGGYQEALFNLGASMVLVFLFLLFEKRLSKAVGSPDESFIRMFILLVLILVFGVFNDPASFIYMQF